MKRLKRQLGKDYSDKILEIAKKYIKMEKIRNI